MERQWERYLLQEAKIVFKYLVKIGVTREDAEDIVQEAIIKTIECLSQIEANKLRAWLFKVALNCYYTLYNKKKMQPYLSDEDIKQFQATINIEEHLISCLFISFILCRNFSSFKAKYKMLFLHGTPFLSST